MPPLSPRALAELFEEAQDLHQAGRLAEALERYKRILAAEPRHAAALHMTGLLAFQNGQHDVAVALMTSALAGESKSPVLHSNLGLALRALGRLDEAIASFRRALSLNPDMAETHNNMGMALVQQGRVEAAVESFARAVRLNPALPAAHANLGDALWAEGKLAEAEASHQRAFTLDASDPEILKSLALLALARGDAGNAVRRICQALALDDSPRSHRVFTQIVQSVRWDEDDPQLRHLLVRAVTEGWSRPALLSGPALALIRARLDGGGSLEGDELLIALLRTTPITDPVLEGKLTQARRALLLSGSDAGGFAAALAQQCFLNEYIWPVAADEAAAATRLKEALPSLTEAQLLMLACYVPLGALAGMETVTARGAALGAVLLQQRDEPARERHLLQILPDLTPVKGTELKTVQARYETAPYPRWTKLKEAIPPAILRAFLSGRFAPATLTPQDLPDSPQVLVAGCGTGQYALEMLRDFSIAGMLAIDISRASLAYAARKAEEAGIDRVRFGVADILAAPSIGRSFDVIECRGVLHHLPDPLDGIRALAGCLNPGGVMLVAFHSRLGRQPVAELRNWVRQEGFAADDLGVRAARARLMADSEQRFAGILQAYPFYTTSACRELLFEQDEKTHDLDQIARALADNGLTLIGLDVSEPLRQAYREKFPEDPAATDLGNWAAFEREYPDIFAGMYNLWLQKARAVKA